MKKALITGITGQDGSYLAEFLLEKGYEVYGMYRRSSVENYFERVDPLIGKVNFIEGDLLDFCSIEKVIEKIRPDEIYNLAAQSDVGTSFNQPHLTREINWLGVERLIDIIKRHVPNSKFYQASTSELYGEVLEVPQNEKTPFNPVSPYAESKLRAHQTVGKAREEGIFACGGILFNHESQKRGLGFITRKITDGLTRVKLGIPQRVTGKAHLELGNLDAKRDWGHAKDYVEAMWMMLQQDKPEDYVIATGETHSVREFVEEVCKLLDFDLEWRGEGIDEIGFDKITGKEIIKINSKYFRPAEVHRLIGDPSKANRELGWKAKIKFKDLVKMMVESDLERNKKIKK